MNERKFADVEPPAKPIASYSTGHIRMIEICQSQLRNEREEICRREVEATVVFGIVMLTCFIMNKECNNSSEERVGPWGEIVFANRGLNSFISICFITDGRKMGSRRLPGID